MTNPTSTPTLSISQYKHGMETGVWPTTDTAAQPPVPRPTKHEVKAEKDLQRQCEQELHRRGIEYLHLSPMAREKKGWPDLTFAWRLNLIMGIPIAVELKAPAGTLSDDQVKVLTNMKANGWYVYVIRDMAVFVDLLNGMDVEQWKSEGE